MLNYMLAGNVITFAHTETPVAARGHGLASRLVQGALRCPGAQSQSVAALRVRARISGEASGIPRRGGGKVVTPTRSLRLDAGLLITSVQRARSVKHLAEFGRLAGDGFHALLVEQVHDVGRGDRLGDFVAQLLRDREWRVQQRQDAK